MISLLLPMLAAFAMPPLPSSSCDLLWQPTPLSSPSVSSFPKAVAIGTEIAAVGQRSLALFDTGTGTWRNAPADPNRPYDSFVLRADREILNIAQTYHPSSLVGSRFDPAEDSWTALPQDGAPDSFDRVAWTGHSLLVTRNFGDDRRAWRWIPRSDSWVATATPPAMATSGRLALVASPIGVILAAGRSAFRYLEDSDEWVPLPLPEALFGVGANLEQVVASDSSVVFRARAKYEAAIAARLDCGGGGWTVVAEPLPIATALLFLGETLVLPEGYEPYDCPVTCPLPPYHHGWWTLPPGGGEWQPKEPPPWFGVSWLPGPWSSPQWLPLGDRIYTPGSTTGYEGFRTVSAIDLADSAAAEVWRSPVPNGLRYFDCGDEVCAVGSGGWSFLDIGTGALRPMPPPPVSGGFCPAGRLGRELIVTCPAAGGLSAAAFDVDAKQWRSFPPLVGADFRASWPSCASGYRFLTFGYPAVGESPRKAAILDPAAGSWSVVTTAPDQVPLCGDDFVLFRHWNIGEGGFLADLLDPRTGASRSLSLPVPGGLSQVAGSAIAQPGGFLFVSTREEDEATAYLDAVSGELRSVAGPGIRGGSSLFGISLVRVGGRVLGFSSAAPHPLWFDPTTESWTPAEAVGEPTGSEVAIPRGDGALLLGSGLATAIRAVSGPPGEFSIADPAEGATVAPGTRLRWTAAADAAEYQVVIEPAGGAPLELRTEARSIELPRLPAGTPFAFRVEARNDCGTTTPSSPRSARLDDGALSAAFELSADRVDPYEAVRFVDRSTGSPEERLWDFGDGGLSRAASPAYAWREPGRYLVRLTLRSGPRSSTIDRTVVVRDRAAQPPIVELVPGLASAPGVNGSRFESRLVLANPGTTTLRLGLEMLPFPGFEPAPPPLELDLPPLVTRSWGSVIGELFGLDRDFAGTLVIRRSPETTAPLVTASTSARDDRFQTLAVFDARTLPSEAWLVSLPPGPDPRTNLTIVNPGAATIDVRLRFLWPCCGDVLEERFVQVPANGSSRLGNVGAGLESYGERFTVELHGSGPFAATASIVDASSGDAELVPATGATPLEAVIEGWGRADEGTTDIHVFNPGLHTEGLGFAINDFAADPWSIQVHPGETRDLAIEGAWGYSSPGLLALSGGPLVVRAERRVGAGLGTSLEVHGRDVARNDRFLTLLPGAASGRELFAQAASGTVNLRLERLRDDGSVLSASSETINDHVCWLIDLPVDACGFRLTADGPFFAFLEARADDTDDLVVSSGASGE